MKPSCSRITFRLLTRSRRWCLLLWLLLIGGAQAQQTREQLASHYYNQGEYAQAAELYEPLYEKTFNKFYYQMLYRCYMELKESKRAERLVEQRLRQFPRDIYLYVDLGSIYERNDNKKKALKQYNKAVELVSTDSKQTQDLAEAFEKENHPDYAAQVYLAGRERTQNQYIYVNELASLYSRMGDYDAMMKEYFDLLDNSPGSISSIQIMLQRMLGETSDDRLAEGLRRTLVQRVQDKPNDKSYLDMMIWFSLQQKDFRFAMTQAKAVDARFPDQQGEQLFRVAKIAQTNGDNGVAAECYAALVKKGADNPYYIDSRVGELAVRFAQLNHNYATDSKTLTTLRQDYQRALDDLGKTAQTVPLMRNYATLLAYYLNDVQSAADVLYDVVELPRLPSHTLAETKLELGDLLLFAGEVWDASLLYMQVEKANKNDVIGATAKFKNAKLSYYNNDFQWAKSQLEVLRASTSKLIANDAMELSLLISDNMEEDSTYDMLERYAAADLLQYRNQLDSAWAAYDDISHRALTHPIFDEVLLQKAKIRMRQGRYDEADSLLGQLADFYSEDILADDALIMRAQLNEEQLNNIEQARSCYEKILIDYPSSLYVDLARKRYNELKSSAKQQ